MKITRKRKEPTKPLAIRLTEEEFKKIKSIAKKKTGGNVSELIRQALNNFS